MHRIDAEQRRARLGARHLLSPAHKADDPLDVARALVAVHSTDAPGVYLAMLARLKAGGLDDVGEALYERRCLVRVMGMRRTVFVVPVELASVVIAACGPALGARERKLLTQLVGSSIGSDVDGWLAEMEGVALAALAVRGEARASELAGDDPRLDVSILLNEGKAYEGRQKIASRVLLLLAVDGRIVRTRPVGSWRSSQYRWSVTQRWLGEPLAHWSPQAAQAELARRWLGSFGPATIEDFRWWSGLPAAAARTAFAELDLAEVDLDGQPGVVLADDVEPAAPEQPWVALLPTLDSTPMGWKHRDFYLGGHGPRLFDATGNIGPTIWCDGRIVGGWAQRESGEILLKVLDDVGSDAVAAIEAAAEELAGHIGPVRLAPRGRVLSPLERELTS